jgi:sterol desaturase/sphingolipid hydroxylase (fatty acid hydroxylase superfamily)
MTTLQTHWTAICATYTPIQIELTGSLLVMLLTFYIPSTIFISLPYLFPEWSRRHQHQPPSKQPSGKDIFRAFTTCVRNNALTASLQALNFYLGGHSSLRIIPTLPSLYEILWQFVFGLLFREVAFYLVHRALHHPLLYGPLHKKHHEFTAPIAFSAQHATFTEQVVANTLPILLPYAIIKAHVVSFWIFVGWELIQTVIDHSGFETGFWQGKSHDRHHEVFRGHYGTLGIMDWFCGTDEEGMRRRREKGREPKVGKEL